MSKQLFRKVASMKTSKTIQFPKSWFEDSVDVMVDLDDSGVVSLKPINLKDYTPCEHMLDPQNDNDCFTQRDGATWCNFCEGFLPVSKGRFNMLRHGMLKYGVSFLE